jgi:hypothetical protein
MKRCGWIFTTILFLWHSGASGQSPEWTLLDMPGKLLKADASLTDQTGWTHYYESKQNKLLLSIYKNGQSIGELEEMLNISSGLLNNYGKGANDLSGADYVQNAFWLTFNRYWRIQQARPLTRPVRVRFYFNQQDAEDLKTGLQRTGYGMDSLKAIQFYALEGGSLHPFAIRTRSGASTVRRFETGKTARIGAWGDFYYAEFELNDLASSGSGGFFIPLEGQQFSISGRITSPAGDPVEDVYVRSSVAGAAVRTTAEGEFTVANLQGGRSYEVTPFSQDRPTRMVTVLDLVGLAQHLVRKDKWNNPWQHFAADADQSGTVDERDLEFLQKLILGEQVNFPGGASWLFFPASFNAPDGKERKNLKLPPGSIKVDRLAQHTKGADFKAIKTGNIWREQDFPNEPPSILDPSFSLGDQSSCGGGELLFYPLLVEDFVGIRGFQFTLQWDPEVLAYDGVGSFNLPHLDKADFGTAFLKEGKLTVAWFTPDRPNTIKLPDGAALCTLRFRAIGRQNTATSIRFVEEPTPVQVLRDNLSAANVFFTVGSLRIEGQSSMHFSEITPRPLSCYGKQDGAIALKVEGGRPPYRYEWSNGATTPTLYNLQAGKYKVTVYDASACPITSDSILVSSPTEMQLHSYNIRQIRCPGANDGAISFKVSGGATPYRYEWSNGAITPWIGQLSQGTYSVTVTDQHGCTSSEVFTIESRQDIFLNYSITPASEPFANDGSIIVRDLMGSPGPQTYEWEGGQKGILLAKAPPGAYRLNVNDAEGCTYLFNFEIFAEPRPDLLSVSLPRELLPPGVFTPIHIRSPEAQTLRLKLHNERSQMLFQQVVETSAGTTVQHIQTPTEPGAYLLQIIPQYGSVVSIRFRVK